MCLKAFDISFQPPAVECVCVCVCTSRVCVIFHFFSTSFNNCWNGLFGSTSRCVGQTTSKHCMLSKLFNWPVCIYWINLWHCTQLVGKPQALNNEIFLPAYPLEPANIFTGPNLKECDVFLCLLPIFIHLCSRITNAVSKINYFSLQCHMILQNSF